MVGMHNFQLTPKVLLNVSLKLLDEHKFEALRGVGLRLNAILLLSLTLELHPCVLTIYTRK